MKTQVKITHDDGQHQEYKKGETGYIDGYVQGGDDRPYAAVVIGTRIVLTPTYALKVIGIRETSQESSNNNSNPPTK